MEAASGIEPLKRVLQTLALATWLRRRKRRGLESREAIKLEGSKLKGQRAQLLEFQELLELIGLIGFVGLIGSG